MRNFHDTFETLNPLFHYVEKWPNIKVLKELENSWKK